MKKIVAIGLNPAYDYTLGFDAMTLGNVNRATEEKMQPAGKGTNVAYYISFLGGDVEATGFLGQENKSGFDVFFEQNSIKNHYITVPGAIRTNVVLLANNSVTDLNAYGSLETKAHWDTLLEKIDILCQTTDIFLLCGSLPKDSPSDGYCDIISRIKHNGKKAYLDTSGTALKHAIQAKPDFIKPNKHEFMELIGVDDLSESDVIHHAIQLHKSGIETVCVSLGEQGIVSVCPDGVYVAKSKPATVKSTVGAGDAFVAGFALCQSQGKSFSDSIIYGVATARTSVQMIGARLPSVASVDEAIQSVTITKEELL